MYVRRKDELKKLAKGAKERLKNGFWETQRAIAENCELNPIKCSEQAKKEFFKKENPRIRISTKAKDYSMYEKVVRIIEDDGGLNPIGQLIDRNYYDTLSVVDKQRYVFDLAETYNDMKMKYDREKLVEKKLDRLFMV